MTEAQAQMIAFRWANIHSEDITLTEIKQALVCLANFYEDNKTKEKEMKLAISLDCNNKHHCKGMCLHHYNEYYNDLRKLRRNLK